jgi:hypothetical protein
MIGWPRAVQHQYTVPMRYLAQIAGTILLTGCVTASPVLPTGDNTYMIDVVSHNQWKQAIETAVVQANAFCASKNQLVTINNSTTAGTDMMSSSKAQVWFTCK